MKTDELPKELLGGGESVRVPWHDLHGMPQYKQEIFLKKPLASQVVLMLMRQPPQRGRGAAWAYRKRAV